MNRRINNPTIGTDFELFLRDIRTGEIVTAEGYIQGSKDQPFRFDESNKWFTTSLDNVLAEGTIPPADNPLDFYNYIQKSVGYIQSILPNHLVCEALPAAILHDKYLQTKHAQTFGCEPDFCVWTRECNPVPESINKNLRSAGGHIHIGYDNPDMEINELLVKAMDLFIGIPSVIQEPDNERKILYGKAGAFRFKNYGIEYRTVSNYYLSSKELTEWVFHNTNEAINFVNEGNEKYLDHFGEAIQNTINNNLKDSAQQMINYFNIKLVA